MRRYAFFIILFCVLLSNKINAQLVVETATGLHLDLSQLSILEPGEDFQNELYTAEDEMLISVRFISNTLDNAMYRPWRVEIKKIDYDWHENLKIQLRRTANGSNEFDNQLHYGTAYQEVDGTSNLFFTGEGNFDYVPIQFKISGFSVQLPAKTYSTELVLTLLDN